MIFLALVFFLCIVQLFSWLLSVCIVLHILFANIQAHWSSIAWAVCLACAKLACITWCFKSDNSLLLRGNVEGCYSRLCFHPDCLLPAVGCSSWDMDLAVYVLGKFIKGLVLFSAAEHIKLPFGTLCHNILACLGQLIELGDFWPCSYSQQSVFHPKHLVLLWDLSY